VIPRDFRMLSCNKRIDALCATTYAGQHVVITVVVTHLIALSRARRESSPSFLPERCSRDTIHERVKRERMKGEMVEEKETK